MLCLLDVVSNPHAPSLLAAGMLSAFVSSRGKILIDKINIDIDGFGGNHRGESHLVATALTFRQDRSRSNGDQMGHAVGVMMDAINAGPRSNSTRDKTRR